MSELDAGLPQLEMLWPTHVQVRRWAEHLAAENLATAQGLTKAIADTPARLPVDLAPGYRMRSFCPEADEEAYVALMVAAGFADWSTDRLLLCRQTALPNGWFLVEEARTGALAATAMANHRPAPYHPFGAELGWVAAHPAHRGRKLGWSVCAAAINRLLQAGYENIYLKTDDFRAPAILTYLRMGFIPFIHSAGVVARWQSICTVLDWPYTPEAWPRV